MILEVCPGLTYWTVPHPSWEPDAEPDSPADWPRDVGCVLAIVGDDAVVIDPLVEDWDWLEGAIGGRPVHVLQTLPWHNRSCAEVRERFGGDAEIINGVDPVKVTDETLFWLPDYATLVCGDRLIGDGAGGLRMTPEPWLPYLGIDHAGLRDLLRPLLDLPVERVLVSHGEPVLTDGRAAIHRALCE